MFRDLRELRLQYPHTTALQMQAALDFAQPLLEVRMLPMLDYRAGFFLEPLLLDARPFGDGSVESLVLVSDALADELDLKLARGRQLRELLLRPLELHGEQRALDLELRRALQAARQSHILQAADQPLRRVPLPPT